MLKCEVDEKKECCSISVKGSGAEILDDVFTVIRNVYLYFCSNDRSYGDTFRTFILRTLENPEAWEVTADDLNGIIKRGATHE